VSTRDENSQNLAVFILCRHPLRSRANVATFIAAFNQIPIPANNDWTTVIYNNQRNEIYTHPINSGLITNLTHHIEWYNTGSNPRRDALITHVMIHELGHAIGLRDNPTGTGLAQHGTVMNHNPNINNLLLAPSRFDTDSVNMLYPR